MSTTSNLLIPISGMTCGACAARIEKVLGRAEGVTAATVNYATEKAEIAWDSDQLDANDLVSLIEKTGFEAATENTTLKVEGMTCSACAARIEKVLGRLSGVTEASVNFNLETASVTTIAGSQPTGALIDAIRKAGFDASSPESGPGDDPAGLPVEQLQLIAATILTLPLVLQMVPLAGLGPVHLPPWMQLLLATPVQFILGARFYKAAFNALRNGSANMDVLVVMGTTSAYLYSLYLTWVLGAEAMGQLYFEASAVIITLVLLGKFLEARAKRSTTEAIRKLMDLQPPTATVLRDGQEVSIAASDIVSGDHLVILPGSAVPADGVVIEGASDIDEALITGESVPVTKTTGDSVTGGAINGTGRLIVEATTVGKDSTLAKIISLVENAQAGKAPVQRLVDKVSAIFVPVVIVIALLTFGITFFVTGETAASLVSAVSVLVIACPCALGLATPTAIMTGTGAAARAGILIRDVESLERAHELNAIVFDKTGTLTEGRPEVVTLHAFDGDNDKLLKQAASVQTASEHPLGKAIVQRAEQNGLDLAIVSDFMSYTGSGVAGTVEGVRVYMGRRGFVRRTLQRPELLR